MKKYLPLVVLCLSMNFSKAQTNTFPASGFVGIGTTNPGAEISFKSVSSPGTDAVGITWHSPIPQNYGIHKTEGSWNSPNYQQLRISWVTGIVLDPGNAYGKSFVEIKNGGLRVSSGNVGIGISNPTDKLAVN